MTDIVERLASLANNNTGDDKAICSDAIAEIMALRTTLEQLRSIVGVATGDGPSFADIKRDIGK